MARKRVQKIPKQAIFKCPSCEEKSKIQLSADKQLFSLTCPKCQAEIRAPMMKCCIVCAFTNKSCPSSLVQEAKIKGLEIKL